MAASSSEHDPAEAADERTPDDALAAGDGRGATAPTLLDERVRASDPTRPAEEPAGDGSSVPLPLDPSRRPGSMGRLGHYEVLNVVGRGGMGVVLRAFDEQLHRNVAIKVMSAQLISSEAARQRFLREARSAAGISHPNVVTIHAVAEQRGMPYLVMEYVEGRTLQDRIAADAPLETVDILRIGSQICDGLAAAHRHGIVHRDIKPANVILEDGIERAKISDFGLARLVMEHSDLTSLQNMVGTPAYMSPEQVCNEEIDHRSDLFSLGCLLYAMVCGRSPFQGHSAIVIARRVKDEPHRPLRQVAPKAPPFLAAIIDRLLEKDPAKRFQSAEELGAVLSAHLAELNSRKSNPSAAAGRPGGRRSLAAAAAIVAALLGAGAIAWSLRDRWKGDGRPENPAVPQNSEAAADPEAAPGPAAARQPRTWTVAADGTANHESLADALAVAGPGDLIEVLDDAEYPGPFRINDSNRWAGVRIVARNGATLVSSDRWVIEVTAVPRLVVEGFKVRPAANVHAFALLGDVTGCRLDNLIVEQPPESDWANVMLAYGCRATAEGPIVIRGCEFRSSKFGIYVGRDDAGTAAEVAHLRVEGNRFEAGPNRFQIANDHDRPGTHVYLNGPVKDVRLERNIFRGGAGIWFAWPSGDAGDLTFDNNTFVACERPFGFTPGGTFAVTARNNLFLDAGLPPSSLPLGWQLSSNGWEAAEQSGAAAGITVIPDADVPVRDPAASRYVAPAPGGWAATAGAGGTLPGHVGAVPP